MKPEKCAAWPDSAAARKPPTLPRTCHNKILRSVSVGYARIKGHVRKDGVLVTTRWMPTHAAIVAEPADVGAGFYRSAEAPPPFELVAEPVQPEVAEPVQVRTNPVATPAETRSMKMDDIQVAPAEKPVEKFNASEIEGQRKQAIVNLCRANKIDERIERNWIENGANFSEVSQGILDVLKTRGETNPQSVAKLDMSSTEVRRYSLLRALRAASSNNWKDAGLELEAHKAIMARSGRNPEQRGGFFVPFEIQHRDMTSAGVSGSNYLVSTDNQPGSFIELLRNRSVAMQMGATRLSGLVGNVTIPRQTAGATAYWLADEGTSITESQPTLTQLSMAPNNVAALTEVSEQMMRQSSPDAEQLVMSDLAKQIALAVDVAIIRGTGTEQPQGIVGTSGVGAVSGTSLGVAGMLEFQTDVATANALTPNCGYITTPAMAAKFAIVPRIAGTNTPIWEGNILDGSVFGFKAMTSNQMVAATMLFGDFSQVILAEWGVLELATHATDFAKGLTGIRAWYTCDVGVRTPAAFSYTHTIT